MKGKGPRFALTLATAFVLLFAFVGSAFATSQLGYSLDTSLGEGNPLGNIHSETSPVPHGNEALWFNHTFSVHDLYLYDDSDSQDTFVPDEISAQRIALTMGARESVDNTFTASAEGLYSVDATKLVESEPVDDQPAQVATYAAGDYFGLDKTKPTAWSDVVPVYDGTASVTLYASDALSGVEFIGYSLDNGPVDELVSPIIPTVSRRLAVVGGPNAIVSAGPGSHTLTFWAFDNAGNQSAHQTVTFSANAIGYTPVLSKPSVVDLSGHRSHVFGSVTPAATPQTVALRIERWNAKSKAYKGYVTYYVPVRAYASSYSLTAVVGRHASYRVRASEGVGVSLWRTFGVF